MLAPDDIYISPLDLNVEQGRIETPFKPVMRFGTPIFAASGTAAGIVALNYLGQRLLDAVRRSAVPISDHLHLLEPRGYSLHGPIPNDAWGFMLGSDRTFGRKSWELGSQGTRIRVEICHNGRGIEEQDAARLFEPFFTTRAKGTGLGLAIVRKNLDQHQGSIRLHPNPPRGTCATVLLPAVPEKAEASTSRRPLAQLKS